MIRSPVYTDLYRTVPYAEWANFPLGQATLWLDAAQLKGYNNGDTVSLWPDLSGRGHVFNVLSGTPLYAVSAANGMPGVDFESGAGLRGTYAISTGAMTVGVVCRCTSTSTAGRRAVQGNNNWLVGPYGNQWQGFNGAFLSSGVVGQTSTPVAYMMTQQSTSAAPLASGALHPSGGGNIQTGMPGTIGLGIAGGNNEPTLAYICEVLIWERILTFSEIVATLNYFKAKWGTSNF